MHSGGTRWTDDRAPALPARSPASSVTATPAAVGTPDLRDLFTGLALTLVVAIPTLVVAEDWHGRPLIDQPGLGWLIPTVVAALAFVAGGGVTGRRQPRLRDALGSAFLMGLLGGLLLLAADGGRRILVNPTLPMGVVWYWLEAAAGSTVLAMLGAASRFRVRSAGSVPVPAGEG